MIGRSWNQALGLVAAYRRAVTVYRPKSSLVAPYACMYRRNQSAYIFAGVSMPKV